MRPHILLKLPLSFEQDVFTLRRQAKTAAAEVGLEPRDQVRLATALSELGRDLLRPGAMMTGTFLFDDQVTPAVLRTVLAWSDDRVASADSLAAVARLLPNVRHRPPTPEQGGEGSVEIDCPLPPAAVEEPVSVATVRARLRERAPATTALDDLRAQTGDLMTALEESRAQRDELERLNAELTETNQGVIALYAELTAELEETNRGVVALYDEEHQLALTLQRTFLPASLPEVPGVTLAVRYLPAASQTEIGGDFYEAVLTTAGLLLAVGDVVGHSLQAAIVMGELRHALRAYAAENHPPHVLLERLDRLLRLHQRGWTATVCVALIEPGSARVHIANAGHLPPLRMAPDGAAEFLEEHGPLLGLGLPQPAATVHDLVPGSRLLMVTDGLVETRDRPLRDSLEDLRRTAGAGPEQPEALCERLLSAFGGEQEDDTVVFAVRVEDAGQD